MIAVMPLTLAALACLLYAADAGKPVDFTRDIRPILSDHCFACHGPDEAKRKAGVRLDTKEGAIGKVIVPGDSSKSRAFLRMSHEKKALRMPPANFGSQPSEHEIALVKKWIDQGAEWKLHWAYEPPVKAEFPKVTLKSWPKNAVDQFVLARLEKEGLKPSPEAPKTTLLRRLSLDLTGLPPTPAEMDAFLADKSPNAYEKQVDRLLASPHYGERMAMQWLDLARYADTHGYHIDSHRDMWPWRDWVIRAYNNNMPYDRFTIEQLAGDLLPNPTKDQLIATGFNRNHMINYEGGAIPEEYLVEYVADRVETTSNVWLSMTMGCARCHDHKYDPIKQADFYKFFAFFNTVNEKGLDGMAGNADPVLPLPDDAQKIRFDRITAAIKKREAELPEKQLEELQAAWEASQMDRLDLAGPESLRKDLQFHYDFEGNVFDASGHYRHARMMAGEANFSNSGVGRGLDFNGENNLLRIGSAELSSPFTLAFWFRFNQAKEETILRKEGALEIWTEAAVAIPRLRRAARLHVELGAMHVRTKEQLIFGELRHFALTLDGATLKLYADGKPLATEIVTAGPISQLQSSAPLEFGVKTRRERFKGQIDDLRLYSRVIAPEDLTQLAVHQPAPAILAVPKDKRTKQQKDALRDYFLSQQAPDAIREAYLDLKQLKAAKVEIDYEIPSTMVMGEAEKPRDTFILARGDYRNARDKVGPAVPSVLPQLPAGTKADRLSLAKWLVDPSNPLTSRVAVNRFWQMYFGLGIVKTSEDFGSQGEPPSHPELLDWLATEFAGSKWDVKAMQRLIVTSATYRQSSKVTPALEERDPQNRLLARMTRFRLPAETVRDNALGIAGLLNPEIGGRSVYPYQPPGIWEELAYGDRFSAQTYTPSHGKDLYRRSMYWFWKRTVPPATLSTFDAPDREKCTSRRAVTNTPLQALILLNDPTYIEAARTLASRALESSPNAAKRLSTAFRAATGRVPTATEAKVLRDLVAKQLDVYAKDPKSAEDLLKIGESPWDKRFKPVELAAWTTVASAILNMDEVVTKE
jgi:hypothetical protein